MRFAAIADIHGNAYALEAVLRDMEAHSVETAVNLGDVFSGPIDPARTAAILSGRDFVAIRGNHDRYLVERDRSEMGPSDQVAYDALEREHLDWIAALPPTRTVFGDVFLCHGTPTDDNRYWLERVGSEGVVRAATLAETRAEAEGVEASLILCAHSHIPRCVRLPDGRVVANPGSVGCPAYDDVEPYPHHMQTGTPNASYALIERLDGDWSVTFRSVPYDHDRAAERARTLGRPDWARVLSTGWFEG